MKKIENNRTNYDLDNLDLDNLNPHPMIQFDMWFNQLSKVGDFNAVTLSTYNKDIGVSSRVVLLKDFDKTGFVFYSNYNSLKARQIFDNNHVSLCFFWPDFQRQVRVKGFAEKTSAIKSE